MDDELESGERLRPGIGAKVHRMPVLLRELEPARVAPFEAGREPSAAIGIPQDLRDPQALADRVQDVEQLLFQLVPRQPFADQVGLVLVGRKSVVKGKSVTVRVDLGGCLLLKNTNTTLK